MSNVVPFERHMQYLCGLIETRLAEIAPSEESNAPSLTQVIRYSLLGKGKRLRPLLLLATLEHMGVDVALGLDAACAMEMLHAASLVLDDLPCMDNAATRRGEPTSYIRYSEESAILASVALINQAYEVVASADHLSPAVRLEIIMLMSQATGVQGLAAGQSADLSLRHARPSMETREHVNQLKTGALFVASVMAGARIANASPEQCETLKTYAHRFGLAFQQLDDLNDQDTNDVLSRERLQLHLAAALAELGGHDRAPSSLISLTRFVFTQAA